MDTIEAIRIANLERTFDSLSRRLHKLSEEKGEASEAYLSVSSAFNYKSKTWDDFREELVDVMIVAADILWLDYPDETGVTPEQKREYINGMFAKKLQKWSDSKKRGQESMTMK